MDPGGDLERRAQARVGRVLGGKWRLDALIGVGGMASVYAATHRVGRRAAVKMLHPEISLDASAKQRFLREGYVANKVGHPSAVSVLDDDTAEDGSAYLVMDLLEGETVEARARRMGKLNVAEVAWIADQVLDVLEAAHRNGIVHRDIKPDNLFLTREGIIKILDFGIARMRDESGAMRATRTGSMLGTPAFMPPEQALGKKDAVDARSDLWAVGATMFDLLTGRTVHVGETVNQLLLAAMTKPAQPIREVAPQVPPPVAAVIDKSLAFEPSGRYQDARTMQHALRAGVAGAQPVPRPMDASPYGQTMPIREEAYAQTVASTRDPALGTLASQTAPKPVAAAATLESASDRGVGALRAAPAPVPVAFPPIGKATESPVSSDRAVPAAPAKRGSRALVIGAVAVSAVVAIGAIALRFAGGSGGGAVGTAGSTAPVVSAAPSADPVPSADTAKPVVTPAPTPAAVATATPSATASAKPSSSPGPRPPSSPAPRPPSKKGILDKW